MNDPNGVKRGPGRPFLLGVGEGLLSGVIAGLILWYYVEQDSLSALAGMIILLSIFTVLFSCPVLHISRKNWRLVLANITGLLLLVGLGTAYMVMVWVLLSLNPPVAG